VNSDGVVLENFPMFMILCSYKVDNGYMKSKRGADFTGRTLEL